MTVSSAIKSGSLDPRRFINRPAAPCRKCGGVWHYVNRCGGVQCESCSPPAEGDCLVRVAASGGVWVEPGADGFAVDAAPEASSAGTCRESHWLDKLRRPTAATLAAVEDQLNTTGVAFVPWDLTAELEVREELEQLRQELLADAGDLLEGIGPGLTADEARQWARDVLVRGTINSGASRGQTDHPHPESPNPTL